MTSASLCRWAPLELVSHAKNSLHYFTKIYVLTHQIFIHKRKATEVKVTLDDNITISKSRKSPLLSPCLVLSVVLCLATLPHHWVWVSPALLVFMQIPCWSEGPGTCATEVGLFGVLAAHVHLHVTLLCERSSTEGALIGTHLQVDLFIVPPQSGHVVKYFVAHGALLRSQRGLQQEEQLSGHTQVSTISWCLSTVVQGPQWISNYSWGKNVSQTDFLVL